MNCINIAIDGPSGAGKSTLARKAAAVLGYLYVDTVAEIAARYGISESKVKTQLHRTRAKLHTYLAKEGIYV